MARWTIERHNDWVKGLHKNEFKGFNLEYRSNYKELIYRWFTPDCDVVAVMHFIIDVSYKFSINKYVENKNGSLCFDEAETIYEKDSVCNENGNYKALAKTCKEWIDTFRNTGFVGYTATINKYREMFKNDSKFRFMGESEGEFGRRPFFRPTLAFTFSKGYFHIDPQNDTITSLELYDEEFSKTILEEYVKTKNADIA